LPTSKAAPNYDFSPAASCHKLVDFLKARKFVIVTGEEKDTVEGRPGFQENRG
jgi:hypothetical protein